MLSYGKIVQVSGPVVDCEFQEGQLPKIREALRVQVEDEVRTMEVALFSNKRWRLNGPTQI